MSLNIYGDGPIGSRAARRQDSRCDLFSFDFKTKKRSSAAVKVEPQSSSSSVAEGGEGNEVRTEPEQSSPVSRKSGRTSRTPSARTAGLASQSVVESAAGNGASSKGKENLGQGSRASNPKRRLTDNTYFNAETTPVEDVEAGPAPTKKMKTKKEQQPSQKKSGWGGRRTSAPAKASTSSRGSISVTVQKKKNIKSGRAAKLSSDSDSDSSTTSRESSLFGVQKKKKIESRRSAKLSSDSDWDSEDNKERSKQAKSSASPPKKTNKKATELTSSNELQLSGMSQFEDASNTSEPEGSIQVLGMPEPDKKTNSGPGTDSDAAPSKGDLSIDDEGDRPVRTSATTVVSEVGSGSGQDVIASANMNPVVLLQRLRPDSIPGCSIQPVITVRNDILASDSDGEEEVELIISDDPENYNQLRNSELTGNVVVFAKELMGKVASFLTPDLCTSSYDIPGIGTSVVTVSDAIKMGYMSIEPKTVRPLDCTNKLTIVYWILAGSITLRSTGGVYSKSDGATHTNYMYGKSLSQGTCIVIPPKTGYFIENWGDEEVLLGYAASFPPANK